MKSTSHDSDSLPLLKSQTVSSFLTNVTTTTGDRTHKPGSESPKIKRTKTAPNDMISLSKTPTLNRLYYNNPPSHKKMSKSSPKKRTLSYLATNLVDPIKSSAKVLKFQNETENNLQPFCRVPSEYTLSISDYANEIISKPRNHNIASTEKSIEFNPTIILSSTPNKSLSENTIKISDFRDYTTPKKPNRYRLSVSEFTAQINDSILNITPDNNELQQDSSVSDWMKSSLTISTVNSHELGDSLTINKKSRLNKPISGGFAEYTQIIMRRLDNEVNLWNHNFKKDSQLEKIDPSIILTVRVASIHNTNSVYSAICSIIEPIPEKVRSTLSFQSDKKVTVIFSARTQQYFEICSGSFVKICPPWTLLCIGDDKEPVFLCTYFSFKVDTPQIEQPDHLQIHTQYTDNPDTNSTTHVILYKEINFDDSQSRTTSTPLSPVFLDSIGSDVNLTLKYNALQNTLTSQSWNSVSLAGTILYVTRPYNLSLASDTLQMVSHLITDDDQCVSVFLIDDKFLISLIFIPYMVIEHLGIELSSLGNKSVLFKSLNVLRRVSYLTSPSILSVVDNLLQCASVKLTKQRYCYCLILTDAKSMLFIQNEKEPKLLQIGSNMLLTNVENIRHCSTSLDNMRMTRLSFLGCLIYIHSETSRKMEEDEIYNVDICSGSFLFALDETSTDICQIYLDASFSCDLIKRLRDSLPQMMIFSNFYHCAISMRPSHINGDNFSCLIPLNKADDCIVKSEIREKASNAFTTMKLPQFPSLDSNSMIGTIISLEGEIIDMDQNIPCYTWYVCNLCHQRNLTVSTDEKFSVFCEDCQSHLSSPITHYHIVVVMSCSKLSGDSLCVQLQQNTIEKLIQTPKKHFDIDDNENINNDDDKYNCSKEYKDIRELIQNKYLVLGACFIRERLILPSGQSVLYLEEILIPIHSYS